MKSKTRKSSCAVLFRKVVPFQITCQKKKKLVTYLHIRHNKIRIAKVFPVIKLFLLGEVEYAVSPDKRQITCPFLAEGIDLRED